LNLSNQKLQSELHDVNAKNAELLAKLAKYEEASNTQDS
jgi:hypothetical protein